MSPEGEILGPSNKTAIKPHSLKKVVGSGALDVSRLTFLDMRTTLGMRMNFLKNVSNENACHH